MKEEDRGEKKFKAFEEILISLTASVINLSIFRFRIFFILRFPKSRSRF
jgi:hypothetical protein